MIIDELINGNTPSANKVAFCIDPPVITLRMLKKSLEKASACCIAAMLKVGMGM